MALRVRVVVSPRVRVVLLGLLRLVVRVRVAVSPGVVLVLRVVLLGLLSLVARVRVAVALRVRVVVAVRVRVVVSPGVVLLAWLGLGRRAVVRRRMRRGGVTMRWCVWMAWMSPLLV